MITGKGECHTVWVFLPLITDGLQFYCSYFTLPAKTKAPLQPLACKPYWQLSWNPLLHGKEHSADIVLDLLVLFAVSQKHKYFICSVCKHISVKIQEKASVKLRKDHDFLHFIKNNYSYVKQSKSHKHIWKNLFTTEWIFFISEILKLIIFVTKIYSLVFVLSPLVLQL